MRKSFLGSPSNPLAVPRPHNVQAVVPPASRRPNGVSNRLWASISRADVRRKPTGIRSPYSERAARSAAWARSNPIWWRPCSYPARRLHGPVDLSSGSEDGSGRAGPCNPAAGRVNRPHVAPPGMPNPLPPSGEPTSTPNARATPYVTPAACLQRPVPASRRSRNSCPPNAACGSDVRRWNRPPITSTASAASVRPTPASTMPSARRRAVSASSSAILPVAVAPLTSAFAVPVTHTVNVSSASTRRSSTVCTVTVPSRLPGTIARVPVTAW